MAANTPPAGGSSAHPDLHIPPPRPLYKRPLVYGCVAALFAFGGGLWAYRQHPEWLVTIVEEDASGRRNLEDLPEGANPEDLAFLFGETDELIPVPLDAIEVPEPEEDNQSSSLLGQFMQGQTEAATPDSTPAQPTANNPFLNPPAAADRGQGTNPLAAFLNPNNEAAPLGMLLNGGDRTSSNPLQEALNQAGRASTPANGEGTAATPTTNTPTVIPNRFSIDPYTGQPVIPNDAASGQGTAPSYAIPGQGAAPSYTTPGQMPLPTTAGGYDALRPADPRGRPAPAVPNPSVPLPSNRRSSLTPLLAPSPTAPAPTSSMNPGGLPGQQFTSPLRQQQQLRTPSAGMNSNQFQRIGGGQINTFGNPLGTPGSGQPQPQR